MDAGALTALLKRHGDRLGVPGAVVGLRRGGETTVGCFGYADPATRRPVTPETRFGIGSITKSCVATALTLMARRGLMSLDDPMATHVPELAHSRWATWATVRDVMANRSRIALRARTEFDGLDRADLEPDALARLAADVRRDLDDDVGADVWSYSNLGWCLLGRVLETVADRPFEDALCKSLLAGCGWQVTFDPRGTAERAVGHELTDDGLSAVRPLTGLAYQPAGAATIASAEEMLRFAALHLDDRDLAELRLEHAAVRIAGWLDGWALGWGRFDATGGHVWGWDGVLPGERSALRLVPDRRTAVVVLTNAEHGRSLIRAVLAELLPELTSLYPRRAVAPSTSPLEPYAGRYAWPDLALQVEAAGDHLLVTDEERMRRPARPLGDGVFLLDPEDPDNPTLTFDGYDERGRPQVLYRMLWGFPRVSEAPEG